MSGKILSSAVVCPGLDFCQELLPQAYDTFSGTRGSAPQPKTTFEVTKPLARLDRPETPQDDLRAGRFCCPRDWSFVKRKAAAGLSIHPNFLLACSGQADVSRSTELEKQVHLPVMTGLVVEAMENPREQWPSRGGHWLRRGHLLQVGFLKQVEHSLQLVRKQRAHLRGSWPLLRLSDRTALSTEHLGPTLGKLTSSREWFNTKNILYPHAMASMPEHMIGRPGRRPTQPTLGR